MREEEKKNAAQGTLDSIGMQKKKCVHCTRQTRGDLNILNRTT